MGDATGRRQVLVSQPRSRSCSPCEGEESGMHDPGTDAERQGIETLWRCRRCALPPATAEASPHTEDSRIRGKVDCARSHADPDAMISCGRKRHRVGDGRTIGRPILRMVLASVRMTSFPGWRIWCSCKLQRNSKRKLDAEGFRPIGNAQRCCLLYPRPPTISDHCRRQWMLGGELEERSAKTRGCWAVGLRKSASSPSGPGPGGPMRKRKEESIHLTRKRISCCVWLTDHRLITHMAANKSRFLSIFCQLDEAKTVLVESLPRR